VLGGLIFGESLSIVWFVGASLVILGVLLIHNGSPQSKTKVSWHWKTDTQDYWINKCIFYKYKSQ
jgi:hypothetical protein